LLAPKRVLSLGGGGIRGILTLEYLSVIEDILKARAGREEFRLSDYFDLIGGTSIGAIIAATLACGMSVAELKTRAQGLDAPRSAAQAPRDVSRRRLAEQMAGQRRTSSAPWFRGDGEVARFLANTTSGAHDSPSRR